jgi:hypothetical protein
VGYSTEFPIPPVFGSPSLINDLDFNLKYRILNLWVEQFLRIGLHQNEKEESGKFLDKNWTKAKERPLMK